MFSISSIRKDLLIKVYFHSIILVFSSLLLIVNMLRPAIINLWSIKDVKKKTFFNHVCFHILIEGKVRKHNDHSGGCVNQQCAPCCMVRSLHSVFDPFNSIDLFRVFTCSNGVSGVFPIRDDKEDIVTRSHAVPSLRSGSRGATKTRLHAIWCFVHTYIYIYINTLGGLEADWVIHSSFQQSNTRATSLFLSSLFEHGKAEGSLLAALKSSRGELYNTTGCISAFPIDASSWRPKWDSRGRKQKWEKKNYRFSPDK